DSAHPAHVQIGDDDVEILALYALPRRISAVRLDRVVPTTPERLFDHVGHLGLVVDDEDARTGLGGRNVRHALESTRHFGFRRTPRTRSRGVQPASSGTYIEMRVPPPSVLDACIHPP